MMTSTTSAAPAPSEAVPAPVASITVIIPTLNEAPRIGALVDHFKETMPEGMEILVCDAGSKDDTVAIAAKHGARVLRAPRPGRAAQMNHASRMVETDYVYFVHADCRPPRSWYQDIQQAIQEGFQWGLFSYRFDSKNPLLRINERFVRYDNRLLGGGDQTLFIHRDTFLKLGGYDESCILMEDFIFFWKTKQKMPFKIILNDVLISARKYEQNNYITVQLANLSMMLMHRFGFAQERMARVYRWFLS